ncbi:hypothetical protein CJU89_4705 [Yarrowia sp. B02]|nr:hypothetical protein CJU89_4705 [Yarrowia sp. B02]
MIISLTVTVKTTLSCVFVLLPIPVAVLAFVAASPLSSGWRAALYLQGAASVVQAASYAVFLVHKGAIPACVASAFVAWLAGMVFYAKVVRDVAFGADSVLEPQHAGVTTAHFALWSAVAALAGAYTFYVLVSEHSSIVAGIETPSAKPSPSTISVEHFKVDPVLDINTSSTVARTSTPGGYAGHAFNTTNTTNTYPTGPTQEHHATPLLPSMEPEEAENPTVMINSLEGLEAIPNAPEHSRHTPSASSFGSINFAGLNIRPPPSSKFIHPSLQIRHNGRRMDRLRHSIDELSDGHIRSDSAGKFDSSELAGPRRESGEHTSVSHRYSTELHTGTQSVFSTATTATELTVKSPTEAHHNNAPSTPPQAPSSPTKSTHSIYNSAHNSLNSSPAKSCSPRKPSRLSRLSRLSLSLEGLNDISPKKLRKSRSDFVLPGSRDKNEPDGVKTPQPDEFNQWEIQDVAWNLRNVSGSSAETDGTNPEGQRSASTASSGVNIITSRGFVREEVV